MPVYEFDFNPKKSSGGVSPERSPDICPTPPQHPSLEEKDDTLYKDPQTLNTPEDIRPVFTMGFESMDDGVKQWLSDIIIPTRDGSRPLEVRVSGGDKTFLVWSQDLRSGRIKLPVCSINRGSWKFNSEKFSPAYIPLKRRYNSDKSRITLSYRPWPVLIDYKLSIWGERKRDVEFAIAQLLTRFNMTAEFRVTDEFISGNVIVLWNGASDNSDVDIGASELAKVRYDADITIEGWLPLSEKTVPSVLGNVSILREFNGEMLEGVNYASRSPLQSGETDGTE